MKRLPMIIVSLLAAFSAGLQAEEQATDIEASTDEIVSLELGLEAWARIYEVTSHPRCSNCHVGPSGTPMWSGPSFGKTRPHGMNITAGESRIGAETLPCGTCHTYRSDGENPIPHAAPQVPGIWQLAPPSAHWFGRSSIEICNQLRDPRRNGGLSFVEIASHLNHDQVLQWAWNPGGDREAAPYTKGVEF